MGLFSRKKTVVLGASSYGGKRVEYMCTYCGQKHIRNSNDGRPSPGRCPRRSGNQPHRWVKNRTL